MQPLSHLESFVRSAETGSFSAAARQLGLTPAAVSKNVARLEAKKLLPAKTRVFIDFVVERLREQDFARRMQGM